MYKIICLIGCIFFTTCASLTSACENDNSILPSKKSFAIDYENSVFLLDGKPFRYVSGSFHYFRTPKVYWRDRLRKLRAAGLNAVSTYVEWSLHQPEPNEWVWDGEADIVEFIKLAQEEDLLVLLRPGPYICAEREFGGFPYWLLSLVPDIKLRTDDARYMKYAEEYLDQLLTRVKPLLRGKGGPIIMVQIENEYGSFYACDKKYTKKLAEIIKKHVENDALLYTTDGNWRKAIECGRVSDAYATIDFGTSANVSNSFKVMRQIEPKGPLVNSEFYPGWLSHWGEKFQRVETEKITKTLDEMLKMGANVNFYMFYGGTNFAFTAGSNIFDNYAPDLTSYDYDAPLDEAGDPTPKYFAIKEVISKYLPIPDLSDPIVSPKGDYGSVKLTPVLRLFDPNSRDMFGTITKQAETPPTFEELNLSNWLVLYETDLSDYSTSKFEDILNANAKDRATVYLDHQLTGTLSRSLKVSKIHVKAKNKKHLKILVENQGRVNFGNIDVEDFKGLFNVSLNDTPLKNWNATGFSFDKKKVKEFMETLPAKQILETETNTLYSGPQVLYGEFEVTGKPLDTYLNTDGWGKGVVFINGHNLGRYWPLAGPQLTLYVPGAYLKEGKNILILVELEYVPKNREIVFQNTAILDYPNQVVPSVNG